MLLLVFAIVAIFFGSIALILRWHHRINAGMALLALDDVSFDSSSISFAAEETSSVFDDLLSA